MKLSFYRRYGLVILIALLVALPVIVFGALSATNSSENVVADWLPSHFEETKRLKWFENHFGTAEMMVISWDGCQLVFDADNATWQAADSHAATLAESLRGPAPFADADDSRVFRHVFTGPEMFEKLTAPPFDLKPSQALLRLEGWLVSGRQKPAGDAAGQFQSRTTCIVAVLSEKGRNYRHEAVEWIYNVADSECGLSRNAVHIAGPSIDSVAIDDASTKTIRPLNFLCWGICFVIASFTLRSIRAAGMMFFIALVCQYLSLAIIYYTGTIMNSILLMVASLVFVLSVSASVHLVNYYREAISRDGLDGAAGRAVGYGWVPCWLAATTTALGMASLMVSKIKPIFTFGQYAAIGVLAGLALLMLALPSWLELWPMRRWTNITNTNGQSAEPDGGPWRVWAGLVIRFQGWITVLGIVLLIIAGYGVTMIHTTVNLHDMFHSEDTWMRRKARVIEDYDWIQKNLGPLIPIEVVLHIPQSENQGARMLGRLRLVERIRSEIHQMGDVGATISAASFGPKVTTGGSIGSTIQRTIANRRLEKHRDKFVELQYLHVPEEPDSADHPEADSADAQEQGPDLPGEELWRISVRVEAATQVDYGEFMDRLQSQVNPQIDRRAKGEFGITGVHATYCGGIPLVNKAQKQLLDDLAWSFLTAFILVGITMVGVIAWGGVRTILLESSTMNWKALGVVLLTGATGGAVSMIPNIVPSVVAFGLMGWMGVIVDIGAMMTASAALGIAVDDTLHFIVWFRRGLNEGYDRPTAVRSAYQRCASAMTQTSLICGVGLLAYWLSPFVPISRFSLIMFMLLFAALLGDLILLPAILSGPLGRFFETHRPEMTDLKEADPA